MYQTIGSVSPEGNIGGFSEREIQILKWGASADISENVFVATKKFQKDILNGRYLVIEDAAKKGALLDVALDCLREVSFNATEIVLSRAMS